MQQLALDKYDELVATEALQSNALSGDFSDRGNDRFLWQANVGTTSVTNLDYLTVTVTDRNNDQSKVTIDGTVFVAPTTDTTTGGTTGG